MMEASAELLILLSRLKNEITANEIDPEQAILGGDFPEIVDKLEACIAGVERLYPLINLCEDLLDMEVSPLVFKNRWIAVAGHMGIDDGLDEQDIGGDVKGFLGQFGGDTLLDEDEDDEDED